MGGATRNGDTAGGSIVAGSSGVFVNGAEVVIKGDKVSKHGRRSHSSPTMAGSSSSVFVNNKGVVRSGDTATCGHPANGSSNVFVDG